MQYTSYAIWEAFYKNNLSSNQFLDQSPNATYFFVNLTVRNDDNKPRSIAPFILVDGKGVEKRGYVVFDVPKGKNYKLKISGGYWSDDEAIVDLNL